MKKGLLACLLFITIVFSFSGCGDKTVSNQADNRLIAEFSDTNGLKLPLTDKKTTLSVLTEGSITNFNDSLYLNTLESVTGVSLNVTLVPPASLKQKIQMLVASKQLPDIFCQNLDNAQMQTLAKNDVIVAFNEYADQMPNFKKLYIDDPSAKDALMNYTMDDGNIYTALGYNIARDVNFGYMYRKDIFDKHGIEPWTNTQEFYDALKKLKKVYPESTPFASKRGVSLVTNISSGWGLNGLGFYFDESQQKYLYGGVQDTFREVLDFFRAMYVEGLIDPEFLTCTEASWTAKMTQNNEAFVTYDWIDRMDLFYEQVKDSVPTYDLRFGYPIGPKGKYPSTSKIGGASFAVRNNDNKDISIKLVDFLLSPAGAQLSTLGVKGQSYELGDDGKVNYLGFSQGELININTLSEKHGLFVPNFALRFDDRCSYYQYTPKNQAAQDLVNEKSLLTDKVFYPLEIKDDGSGYRDIMSNLDKEGQQAIFHYILGGEDQNKVWQDWVNKATELGVAKATEIYNQAYAEMRN